MTNQKLVEVFDNIIGLTCCQIRVGFAGILVIGFGDLIEYDTPKLQGKYHGAWEIRTNTGSWRVSNRIDGQVLVGSSDDETYAESLLPKVQGSTLENVVWNRKNSDITISLSQNIDIEIVETSSTDYSWEMNNSEYYWEIGPKQSYRKIRGDHTSGISREDEGFMAYAQSCVARWKKLIPKSIEIGQCRHCLYYRPLEGKYDFWDFGVCSHPQSTFDGKIVEIVSGCEKFITGDYEQFHS